MLNVSKVKKAIQAKKGQIEMQTQNSHESFVKHLQYCEKLSEWELTKFNDFILKAQAEKPFIGALITNDLKDSGFVSKFGLQFNQPAEIAHWKSEILENRIVCAVDGSQIDPDKNLNLFFGAVQASHFINYHNAQQKSDKDVDFEIILPSNSQDEDEFELRQKIAFERTAKEIINLIKVIDRIGKLPTNKRPLAFFDGSLTFSFVKQEKLQKDYNKLISQLIEKSQLNNVPVIGFIDTSLAFNLTSSLKAVFGGLDDKNFKISDSSLLSHFLSDWGSRSAYFEYCNGNEMQDDSINKLGFCYLKTSSKAKKPARLEIPHWVYEAGLLNEVINIVLAECLVGNGYPYSLEVADSTAVIQMAEREYFYGILEKELNHSFLTSSKQSSKNQRRRSSIKLS